LRASSTRYEHISVASMSNPSSSLHLSRGSVSTSAPKLSADMVRTKSYDSSARIFKPSMGLAKYNIPSAHQSIDRNSYSHPCDRIGRMYTQSAAGLTMEKAEKVSLYMRNVQHQKNKVMGFSLAATAPDAFDATHKISELAMSSSSGKLGGAGAGTGGRKEPLKPLPSIGSPLALRENHRLIRSHPQYTIKEPLVSSGAGRLNNEFTNSSLGNATLGAKNFDDWNPESIDAPKEQAISEDALYESLPYEQKLKAKNLAGDLYINAIEYIVQKGVLTAAGSGSRNEIVPLSAKKMRNIVHLIPSVPRFLESRAISDLLGVELTQVGEEYIFNCARACVDYDLKDRVEAENMGVNLYNLRDQSIYHLWTDVIYQLPEWRVLRQTLVDPDSVLRSLNRMNHQLCTTLRIMQELQYFWLDGQLPMNVWESLPLMARCSYNDLLFTQVNSMAYRHLLPLPLDEFVGKVEYHSKFIKDALCDNWLTYCGNRLSHFIAQMSDESDVVKVAVEGLLETNRSNNAHGLSLDAGNDPTSDEHNTESGPASPSGEFGKFKSMAGPTPRNTAAANKALANRLAAEGLEGKAGGGNTGRNRAGAVSVPQSEKKRTKAEMVVDSSVVLLSKQLRGEGYIHHFCRIG
jgi:hypothetical protein